MEDKIIKLAKRLAEQNFMDYPDYDPDIPLSLADALTVIIIETESELVDELESHKVYDFITSKLN
jgi:hypothetical protein